MGMPLFASPVDLQSMFAIDVDVVALVDAVNIDARYALEGDVVGYAQLTYRPHQERLTWKMFYPYGKRLQERRRGLGTLAHATTLLSVLDEVSVPANTAVIHLPKRTSEQRRAHLAAMNIDCYERLRFDDYFERSFLYARRKGFLLACGR